MLCWQHQHAFLDALHGAVRCPEDHHDEAIQSTAQAALAEIAHDERSKRSAARRAATLVYFVERDGFVKIGYSSDLKTRLRKLNRGDCFVEGMTVGPVKLLATIESAGEETESWLHQRFDHLRIGGEWFHCDEELRSFISGLKGCRTSGDIPRAA